MAASTFLLILILLQTFGVTTLLRVLHGAHWQVRGDEMLRTTPASAWALWGRLVRRQRTALWTAGLVMGLPTLGIMAAPLYTTVGADARSIGVAVGLFLAAPLFMLALAAALIPRIASRPFHVAAVIVGGYFVWILVLLLAAYALPDWLVQVTETRTTAGPGGTNTSMTTSHLILPLSTFPVPVAVAVLAWWLARRRGERWFRLG